LVTVISSAGAAMLLASIAETVYSYLQVSLRLVQRWVNVVSNKIVVIVGGVVPNG